MLLLFVAALAVADKKGSEKIAEGVTIGGVDVGGLEREAAVARLEQQIGAPSRRPVKVRVAGKTKRLTADQAGVEVDLNGAVDRAMAASRDGNFVGRG